MYIVDTLDVTSTSLSPCYIQKPATVLSSSSLGLYCLKLSQNLKDSESRRHYTPHPIYHIPTTRTPTRTDTGLLRVPWTAVAVFALRALDAFEFVAAFDADPATHV